MDEACTNGCPGCCELQRQVDELKASVCGLTDTVKDLRAQLARAQKNSSNSSKPPSSDIVRPPKPKPKPKEKEKRKRGGQPGHPKHERPPLEPGQIDRTEIYPLCLSGCPDCGGALDLCGTPALIVNQIDLIAQPVETVSHVAQAGCCQRCNKIHYAKIDPVVAQCGLFGPDLTAVIAVLKGVGHCSYSTIRKFVRDVLGVTISRGMLAKLIARVSDCLAEPYDLILALLPQQHVVNVDETGHKENGRRLWTWVFRALNFTLFRVDESRGSDVLLEVLGRDFDGVLGCDYFSAYRKYMRQCGVELQFCLAHLIRDIKFLVDHPNPDNRTYGKRLLVATRRLFGVIHQRDQLSDKQFAGQLEDAANELCGTAQTRVPDTREANNLANRFEKHGDAYIRFVTTPGIGPTNNLAEQAIRFVVIDRKVTQGTRGETGRRWCERIWTTIATCAQNGRSVFAFIKAAISANIQGLPAPKLVPNSS